MSFDSTLSMVSFNQIIATLVITVFILSVIGAVRRIRLWCSGQPNKVNIIAGLTAIPRRYLVDLHHVVMRDKYMSHTHVATAGGCVLSLILIVLVYICDLKSHVLVWGLLCSTGLMTLGACCVYARRRDPPPNLSKGAWMRLPKSLLAFSVSFFLITLPATGLIPNYLAKGIMAIFLVIGVLWGISELFLGMTWGGPMKHAFAGALHLGFHRRQERFNGGHSTGLKPIDININEADNKLGVEKPTDFKWNQLLGFDACVQCGRCEKVCPAFASGQPLNPKKLIQDMVVGMTGGTDKKYTGSQYPGKCGGEAKGGPSQVIVDGLISQETLWSCTTCRACVEECPMMIEHVDAIVDMRRYLTLERGATPNKGVDVIENLIATDNPNGFNPQQRTHWAADQNLTLMSDVKTTDVLFWVSDGAFDMRSQRILRAFVKLLKAANVDFAILGDEELDCGDLARRLGDEATFQRLALSNIKTLKKYQFNHIVTTDPHAFHVLKNEYKYFDGEFSVMHHTTFLNRLVAQQKLRLDKHKGGKVTYHDPCYLGRYNREYESPRLLLNALGVDYIEMERSRYRSRCCGGGGAAPITDIPGEKRIADMRMDDIRATDAELVAVGCQQCTAMLEGVVEPRPEVKDIAEIMVENLVEVLH